MTFQNKILLVVDGRIYRMQSHGGISRNFNSMLSAMVKTDRVDLTLVLSRGTLCPDALSAHAEVRYSPVVKNWRPGRVFKALNESRSHHAEKIFWGGFEKGLFHSTYYSTHQGLRIPQALTFHDAIYERFPEFFNDASAKRHIHDRQQSVEAATALIFPSEESQRECAAFYDIENKRQRVVSHAVDPCFLPRPLPEAVAKFRHTFSGGSPFFLHSGGRYLHKNFDRLLDAYARWDGCGRYRLLSVGGGPWTPAERKRIEALGLTERVVAVPRLPESDLVAAYYAADAFVFPSLCEGFGFPLLEAMAAGLPVAAANAGSLPEVGRDVPIYFDPRSVDEMVQALCTIEQSIPDRSRWNRGRELASSRTWDDVANEVIGFYEQVL